MAEETQEEKKDAPSDGTKKTEPASDVQIPKARFDEVLSEKKALEDRLAAREQQDEEDKRKKLEEDGKLKELLEITKSENERLRLEGLKRDLVAEAVTNKKLHPKLSKMVQGSNEEEIKKSLADAIEYNTELVESLKNEKTADDTSGKPGKNKETPMSAEEWMRLYEKDPAAADEYLRKQSEHK